MLFKSRTSQILPALQTILQRFNIYAISCGYLIAMPLNSRYARHR